MKDDFKDFMKKLMEEAAEDILDDENMDIGNEEEEPAEEEKGETFEDWVNSAPLAEVLQYVFPDEFEEAKVRWEEGSEGEEEGEPEEEEINPDLE